MTSQNHTAPPPTGPAIKPRLSYAPHTGWRCGARRAAWLAPLVGYGNDPEAAYANWFHANFPMARTGGPLYTTAQFRAYYGLSAP